MTDTLARALDFFEARSQGHSVGVLYPQSQLRIDLVPLVRSGRRLLIPSLDDWEWIKTFPQRASPTAATLG